MKSDYVQPEFLENGFNCPHCEAFSQQEWESLDSDSEFKFQKALCGRCNKISLWRYQPGGQYWEYDSVSMIYPAVLTAPLPADDMPKKVMEIYEEARSISSLSPRSTAALLRVALEKLTEHLGESKGKLNTRIGNLKKQGLPEDVIKSLDIVRVTANEGGSHAGEIDLSNKDNSEIVDKLFFLVNFIVEKTITDQKNIKELFKGLPKNKKEGIKNRDKD
jgi:hypothetical protein